VRIRRTAPGLNRRGFLAVSAAGLGAAGLAASGTAVASASSGSPGRSASSLTEAVLAAFRTNRLVTISDSHAGQETHDLLMTLISDPRLYGVVNDIIVEFGNAFYQDTLDRFILSDEPVNDADLRPVWRNTTQSPNIVLDAPIYEQIYRRVRAVNWTLPPGKQIRVLAGDPPFDWSKVTSASQIPEEQRNTYPASVIEQQVLAKGRRGLLFYGGLHLIHNAQPSNSSIVWLVEQNTGVRAYVILDLMPLSTDLGGLFAKLAAYPRGTVIPTAGTWFGQLSAGDILPGAMEAVNGQPPKLVNPWCGQTLGQQVDAGLYLGQAADMTASWPNPAIYLDPVYWAELQRRNAILTEIGVTADLNTFRQQQPPAYPLPQAGPAC
jgi:hypothetical protein